MSCEDARPTRRAARAAITEVVRQDSLESLPKGAPHDGSTAGTSRWQHLAFVVTPQGVGVAGILPASWRGRPALVSRGHPGLALRGEGVLPSPCGRARPRYAPHALTNTRELIPAAPGAPNSPAGTADSSPPFQRWVPRSKTTPSPVGAKESHGPPEGVLSSLRDSSCLLLRSPSDESLGYCLSPSGLDYPRLRALRKPRSDV